jgi:uncharacterized phage protein (TIGR01671 family)
MYDTNVNKMYMPNDFEEVESIYECIKQQINWDLDADYDIKFNHLEDGRFFMQCTGLKDKNGKLIYEGDIVKFNYDTDEIIAVVSWDDNEGQVGYYLNTTDYFKDKYVTDYDFYKNDYEVIGNIYENKSLLESEG